MPTYVYPILAVAVLLLIFFISGYLKASGYCLHYFGHAQAPDTHRKSRLSDSLL